MSKLSTRLIVFATILMFLLASCDIFKQVSVMVPTQAPIEVNAIYTDAARTLSAQLTINAPIMLQPTTTPPTPPTNVPIPFTATFTPIIFTLTPTASVTPIWTSTSTYTTISAEIDTNCRSGPGPEYKVIGYFLVGQTSRVLGRNSSSTWWNIENPEKPNTSCWVWGGSTDVSGSTGTLPVFTPPPHPPTETPGGAAFTASFSGTHKCSGDKYAIFSVKNVSGSTFESANIKTKRVDTDAIISNASSNKPFMDSSSDCPPGASALDAGDKAFVASLIEGAPSGKDARTIIYMCTKDGLDGKCVSVSVNWEFP